MAAPPKPPTLAAARAALRKVATAKAAAQQATFVKRGPGEYGAKEKFLGVTTPKLRAVAKEFKALSMRDAATLVKSAWHEERSLGLELLIQRFKSGSPDEREQVFRTYVRLFPYIDCWDFVDQSAAAIAGAHVDGRGVRMLEQWARSQSLWVRRISIVSTHHFLSRGEIRPSLRIAELLVRDTEDLIHKAVGWTLREIGKVDRGSAERFLGKHIQRLPRTMLRYAIELYPEESRREYLAAGK